MTASPVAFTASKGTSTVLPKDTSIVSLLLAVVVAGMLGSSGFEAYKAMDHKADTQAEAVTDFQEWKRQYTQLLPLEEKWATTLRPLNEARDLYSLHQMLGSVPSSNPDTLLVDKLDRVTQNERDLGAQRVCLSSGYGGGVLFAEKDFPTLMAGLEALAKRPDIQMGTIRLSQDKAQARAVVYPLCLLLRDEEVVKP